jgi:rubrerythrin
MGARGENDQIQVLSGLKEGERVVTSGQFMLDSESQLREAIQKMLSPGAAGSPTPGKHAGDVAMVRASSPVQTATPPPSSYVCPMPEHASIKYAHPGKCPICGMTLIPATDEQSPVPLATPLPSASATPAAMDHQS